MGGGVPQTGVLTHVACRGEGSREMVTTTPAPPPPSVYQYQPHSKLPLARVANSPPRVSMQVGVPEESTGATTNDQILPLVATTTHQTMVAALLAKNSFQLFVHYVHWRCWRHFGTATNVDKRSTVQPVTPPTSNCGAMDFGTGTFGTTASEKETSFFYWNTMVPPSPYQTIETAFCVVPLALPGLALVPVAKETTAVTPPVKKEILVPDPSSSIANTTMASKGGKINKHALSSGLGFGGVGFTWLLVALPLILLVLSGLLGVVLFQEEAPFDIATAAWTETSHRPA